jgi:tartrate dehydrogenase/decarboxylase / D-malate dehydrogenase
MMLRHLGVPDAADGIEDAIADALAHSDARTPDIGGKASTTDLGEAIAALVKKRN